VKLAMDALIAKYGTPAFITGDIYAALTDPGPAMAADRISCFPQRDGKAICQKRKQT
jgi:hypothetical protein